MQEKSIMATLLNETNIGIDEIAVKANLPMSIVSSSIASFRV